MKATVRSILKKLGLFDLAVSLVLALRKRRIEQSLSAMAAKSDVKVTGSGRTIERPVLIASDLFGAKAVEASLAAQCTDTIVLAPGDGSPDTDHSLRKPSSGNLAGWLAADEPRLHSAVATWVVDRRSLELLRGRVLAGQHLLLVSGEDSASLPEALGAPSWVEGGLAYFKALPADWHSVPGRKSDHLSGGWPKISMVMVSFNQAPYLEQGIRSILDQGYPNLELIMIDGGSTDGSVDILERYRDKVDVLVIEEDRGQSDGLNKGFDRATGDIVSWLNSDDLLLPGALFRVAESFRRHKVDMVVGGCRQVAANGRDVVLSHHTHLPLGKVTPLPLQDLLNFDGCWLAGWFFFQPEVFFTRDIWLRSGGGLRLDLYYVLDYDLWVRMAAAGAMIFHIPDYLAASRIHELQKTTFGETPFVPEARRLLAEYADGVQWTRPADA